jgi:ankyrin repeat protein
MNDEDSDLDDLDVHDDVDQTQQLFVCIARVCDNPDALAELASKTDKCIDLDGLNEKGRSCAHVCAKYGRLNSLRWLVEAGADLEIVDNRRRTPLQIAGFRLQVDCVLLLLAAGADVHASLDGGPTVLHVAAYLLRRQDEEDPSDAGDVICACIAAGADIDAVDDLGNTPRHLMSKYGFALPTHDELVSMRRAIDALQFDLVRRRALQVCLGLQPLGLDALQMCEVLRHACGRVAPLIPFHRWWQLATTVKHFQH